jgi:hypothetical protein
MSGLLIFAQKTHPLQLIARCCYRLLGIDVTGGVGVGAILLRNVVLWKLILDVDLVDGLPQSFESVHHYTA